MSELPRYMNCLICKHYHTTYPYCDMCIEGNKFECACGPTYKAGDKILYKRKEHEILSDSISIKEEKRSFDEIVDLSTSCLICGAPVPMENPRDYPKICEKCKEAVMFVRRATDDQKELRKNRLRWARDVHKLTHPDDDMSDWPNPDEKE